MAASLGRTLEFAAGPGCLERPMSLVITVLPLCRDASCAWAALLKDLVSSGDLTQGAGGCTFQIAACASADDVVALFEERERSGAEQRYILVSDAITETLGRGPKPIT